MPCKSISIGKFQFYSILPFQKVTLSLYHPILQYFQHPKTLFLLKYYFFNLSLLFLSNRHFVSNLVFLGFLTVNCFSSFSPSTSSTGSTHRATHTYPWYTDQPIQTHHHTHTQTQTIKPSTKPYTHINHQTSWSKQRPPHPPPKPPIRNPHRWFETHRSKPIKKKIITEPPSELPMINPTDPPTDQQIHRFKPTINRSQPTDPNPIRRSTMRDEREAVWSFTDPQPTTHFSHNPITTNDLNTGPNHDPQPL